MPFISVVKYLLYIHVHNFHRLNNKTDRTLDVVFSRYGWNLCIITLRQKSRKISLSPRRTGFLFFVILRRLRKTSLGFCLRVIVNEFHPNIVHCLNDPISTQFQLSDFDNLIAKEICTFLVFLNYTSAGYFEFFFCIFEMAWSRAFQKCIFYDFLDIFLQTFLLCITGFWRKPFFGKFANCFQILKVDHKCPAAGIGLSEPPWKYDNALVPLKP